MTGKTKRRSLLRRAAKAVLAGAMGITAVGAHAVEKNSAPLQVTVPERIKSGEPFTLQVYVPKLKFVGDETRWVEAWLGREYLGRFEIANPTINASLTITIALTRSTTLRVRDFYGRTIVKKLLVV
ncbi:MAG: hypothetical protein RMK89_05090 [Armatimonadota bacterium]|nr:hypothetical protein [Armatimonadota bacterium]MDW8142820.1 hypothetical protein [Armatimonadota bacterium]